MVDALDALQKCADALQAVSQFDRDRVQIDSSALLEVGELCNLEPVEENLPPDAPGAQGRRLPVVFLKANVVFLEVNSDGSETLQVHILHIDRRGLKDDLKLQMLVQPVRIFSVATVGGPTARLSVRHAIGSGPEHAQEGFRMHCPCPDFHIVRLLQHAALPYPELRQFQNQILKCDPDSLLKFYFNFQVVSKSSRVFSFRSLLCSIQFSAASRNSLNAAAIPGAFSMRSSRSPANRSPSWRASKCRGFIPGRRHFSQRRPGSQGAWYATPAPNSAPHNEQRSNRGSHPPRRTVQNAK